MTNSQDMLPQNTKVISRTNYYILAALVVCLVVLIFIISNAKGNGNKKQENESLREDAEIVTSEIEEQFSGEDEEEDSEDIEVIESVTDVLSKFEIEPDMMRWIKKPSWAEIFNRNLPRTQPYCIMNE